MRMAYDSESSFTLYDVTTNEKSVCLSEEAMQKNVCIPIYLRCNIEYRPF